MVRLPVTDIQQGYEISKFPMCDRGSSIVADGLQTWYQEVLVQIGLPTDGIEDIWERRRRKG